MENNTEKNTNLVFAGENPDSLIEPIKHSLKYGNDKLIIVVPEKKESRFTNIKDQYSHIFNEVRICELSIHDTVECAIGVFSIIEEEKKFGKKVVINISNSLPIFIISAHISASLSKSKIIMQLNNNLIEVPVVPYCKPILIRRVILNQIPDEGIDSQMELEDNINKEKIPELNKKITRVIADITKENAKIPPGKKQKKLPTELTKLNRSNLSQHLNILQERGYIERKDSKSKREKSIHLTSLGKLTKIIPIKY